jgi:hypothetical protein
MPHLGMSAAQSTSTGVVDLPHQHHRDAVWRRYPELPRDLLGRDPEANRFRPVGVDLIFEQRARERSQRRGFLASQAQRQREIRIGIGVDRKDAPALSREDARERSNDRRLPRAALASDRDFHNVPSVPVVRTICR